MQVASSIPSGDLAGQLSDRTAPAERAPEAVQHLAPAGPVVLPSRREVEQATDGLRMAISTMQRQDAAATVRIRLAEFERRWGAAVARQLRQLATEHWVKTHGKPRGKKGR